MSQASIPFECPAGDDSLANGIAVELIVPDHIKQLAVIDLIERGVERIEGRIAHASATLFQLAVLAACKRELSAEILVFLYVSPEQDAL